MGRHLRARGCNGSWNILRGRGGHTIRWTKQARRISHPPELDPSPLLNPFALPFPRQPKLLVDKDLAYSHQAEEVGQSEFPCLRFARQPIKRLKGCDSLCIRYRSACGVQIVIIDYSTLTNDGISQLDMDLMAGCGLRPATFPVSLGCQRHPR
ncbi:hypothetical protein BJX68DRAFT_62789 [Aspergillus pseudodeflectus]|uniref:Uncharacterized protein n=1 Tax=Aspergillus pseudodeflectus TaxID=176178 RepID=A0ABR4KJ46_9EURO